jgi:hypothetical protein
MRIALRFRVRRDIELRCPAFETFGAHPATSRRPDRS